MKPFLLLQVRPEDEAAADEARAFREHADLSDKDLVAVRVESTGVPPLDLDDYSAVVIGGGPSNVSDPAESKPAAQIRFEQQLFALVDDVRARDLPFFGSCYGVGILGAHGGGVISRRFPEPVGAATVTLTPEGERDPLTAGLPSTFDAFTGHKESCEVLPGDAVLLATSSACPVQMFKVGRHAYATQFHTELDADGLETRVRIYRNAGYFPSDDAETLIAAARRATVTQPVEIWRRFVERYAVT